MKSYGVLLLVLIAFLTLNLCVAEKVCEERAIAVLTTEGTLCVCSQGYFGKNCQLKVSALEKNEKSSNETDEHKCRFWYQCFAVRWFNLMRSFQAFFKDFERMSFVIGLVTGVCFSPILRAIVYAVVRLLIVCNRKKNRKGRRELRTNSENMASSGSVVIEMEPQLECSEIEQECPEAVKDYGADSQPIDQPELPKAGCASEICITNEITP